MIFFQIDFKIFNQLTKFALIFLIGRSFYTGCNQEEIKNIKKKSKSLINEGLRRATFAELPDVFNENKGLFL